MEVLERSIRQPVVQHVYSPSESDDRDASGNDRRDGFLRNCPRSCERGKFAANLDVVMTVSTAAAMSHDSRKSAGGAGMRLRCYLFDGRQWATLYVLHCGPT